MVRLVIAILAACVVAVPIILIVGENLYLYYVLLPLISGGVASMIAPDAFIRGEPLTERGRRRHEERERRLRDELNRSV